MDSLGPDILKSDIQAIARIDAVPMILDIICRTTGMGFAAVARVTPDRWIACSVKDDIGFGLKPGGELDVATTICHDIRQSGDGVIFDDARAHPVFSAHHTPKIYGLRSYISLPIILGDGSFFGTLCAIDPQPHKVDTPETVSMFTAFARLIAMHLDNNARVEVSDRQLREEREAAELRERFIAVLSQDLRNPLGAITSGASLLQKTAEDERSKRIITMIEKSSWRMTELIENLLDFARGRLGGGVSLNRTLHATLEPSLTHVINELRAAWPERSLDSQFAFAEPVEVDGHRIGQMVSNLLGNAFTHGDPDQPVRVHAATGNGILVITVANGGTRISPEVISRLFQPFQRGDVHNEQQGLGLGLFIASEIARAHGGKLTVDSSDAETVFRFTMLLG